MKTATKFIADLDDKVRVAEETNYVMGPARADRRRPQGAPLDMYATQRDVEKQLAALDDALSEAARDELYGEQG